MVTFPGDLVPRLWWQGMFEFGKTYRRRFVWGYFPGDYINSYAKRFVQIGPEYVEGDDGRLHEV